MKSKVQKLIEKHGIYKECPKASNFSKKSAEEVALNLDFFKEIKKLKTETDKLREENEEFEKFALFIRGVDEPCTLSEGVCQWIFGKTLTELRKEFQLKRHESIRQYLRTDEEKRLYNAENMIVSLITGYGWGYDQIKAFIQENAAKRIM